MRIQVKGGGLRAESRGRRAESGEQGAGSPKP